jgi:hypothetical protein
VSKLAKRFAAIVACVAAIGVVDTAGSRTDLGGQASATVMRDHAGSNPAEFGISRAPARRFASARQQRRDTTHLAMAGSGAFRPSNDRGAAVGCDSVSAIVSVPLRRRGDRGPPSHVLS